MLILSFETNGGKTKDSFDAMVRAQTFLVKEIFGFNNFLHYFFFNFFLYLRQLEQTVRYDYKFVLILSFYERSF